MSGPATAGSIIWYTAKNEKTNLSFLGFIIAIFWKEVSKNVAAACCQVDQRTFLADTESSRHRHHHTNGLRQQGPLAEIAADHKTTQDSLYLPRSTTITHCQLLLTANVITTYFQ